jgi:hypothetical protein
MSSAAWAPTPAPTVHAATFGRSGDYAVAGWIAQIERAAAASFDPCVIDQQTAGHAQKPRICGADCGQVIFERRSKERLRYGIHANPR